ncbi:EAL domain-containing protein [Anaeromicrobium sediminis]|uniref:Diguanylate cyclase n=1 Tax=Anaeromicrobium sediminis TaxID=1478221 RepID=A0A267MBM7_9FIRM|nr:EAL domain-containing protein [Anaeromicrobium sediminis]PAB56802.1 hypothetical protein CCE28_20215 [Anaeromicrobium sediminis]
MINLRRGFKDENGEQYRSIVENMDELICKFLPDTTLIFVNNAYCDYFNKRASELIGTKFLELIPKTHHMFVMEKLKSFNINNHTITYEHSVVNAKGKTSWIKWTDKAIFDENDNIIEFQSIGTDITHLKKKEENLQNEYNEIELEVRKRTKDLEESNNKLEKEIKRKTIMEKELRDSEERYRKIVELSPNGIFIHIERKIVFANSSITKLLGGEEPEELIGKNILSFIHRDYHSKVESRLSNLNINKDMPLAKYKFIKVDGKTIDVEVTTTFFTYQGKPAIFSIARDISHRIESEKQIKYMAYYDTLTELPNRHFLNHYFEEIIKKDDRKQTLAVMFIDLDRFKIINDTLGHTFGDMVLKQVSRRLVKYIGKDHTICRHGGDEFIILMSNVSKEKTSQMAEGIISEFTKEFIIENHKIFISPSIGISLYPFDGHDGETLIKCADMAMYLAKEKGRNNYQFYISNLSQRACKKMYLENGLRKALENNEFTLYYQPQFNLSTEKFIGVEALIRWEHPDFGIVSPMEFIPLAEESGLIIPIGKWILENACRQNKIWEEAGFPQINIAVNISPVQFKSKDFVKMVEGVLKDTNIDPKYLELEITESIMQNMEDSILILNKLKNIGIKVSIDDFGTGYSSLSVLQNLPIDTLKIDQSFINDIKEDFNISPIVKTIIDMGNNLNLNIIAEGIEREYQIEYLKENKCFIGQGYLLSKPLSVEKINDIFKKFIYKG